MKLDRSKPRPKCHECATFDTRKRHKDSLMGDCKLWGIKNGIATCCDDFEYRDKT